MATDDLYFALPLMFVTIIDIIKYIKSPSLRVQLWAITG